MRIGIETDHGGYGLKEELEPWLRGRWCAAWRSAAAGSARQSAPTKWFSAKQGVEDDRMNILCMGGRTVGSEVACDLVQA